MAFPANPPIWYVQVGPPNRNAVFYSTFVSDTGGGGGAPVDPRQAFYEAAPYNWVFFTNSFGFGARRRQESNMIEQTGASLVQLLNRIDDYEAQASSLGVPVSHEWGHVFGHSATNRAHLRSL